MSGTLTNLRMTIGFVCGRRPRETFTRCLRATPATFGAWTFDPTGRLLATGDRNGTAIVWDVATGKRLAGFHEDNDPVYAVAFSAKGSRLIVGRHSGQIRVMDVESDKSSPTGKRAGRLECSGRRTRRAPSGGRQRPRASCGGDAAGT